jgi:hypothetical protein
MLREPVSDLVREAHFVSVRMAVVLMNLVLREFMTVLCPVFVRCGMVLVSLAFHVRQVQRDPVQWLGLQVWVMR